MIVDVGGLLRTEEVDDPFNGLGLRRDCAAVGALQVCDSVVAVTRPDVVGLARLVEDLPDVLALTSHLRVDVVVNQVSRRSRGVESNVKRLINEVGPLDFPVHPLAFDDGVRTCVERGSLFSGGVVPIENATQLWHYRQTRGRAIVGLSQAGP